MKYTVVWLRSAQNGLAKAWTEAADRNAFAAASHRLDQRLRHDPLDVGESREDTERMAFEGPLQVVFEVLPDDRRVEIIAAKLISRRWRR